MQCGVRSVRKEGRQNVIGMIRFGERIQAATATPNGHFTHTTPAHAHTHRQDRTTETLSRLPGQRRPRVRRAFRKQATRFDKGKREEANKPCRPPCLIIHTIFLEVRTHYHTSRRTRSDDAASHIYSLSLPAGGGATVLGRQACRASPTLKRPLPSQVCVRVMNE